MNTEIKAGDRVRVNIEKNGLHKRSFTGTVVRWTPAGRITVREEGVKDHHSYNPDFVRKIAIKQP